jgi:hypothetical protein
VRLLGALETARRDGRLSELDRRVHRVYCERALEIGWVEIMASDGWVCERIGVNEGAWRSRVWRSRQRLEKFGYARRLKENDVTHRGLKAQVAARKVAGSGRSRCSRCARPRPSGLRALRWANPGYRARIEAILLQRLSRGWLAHRRSSEGRTRGRAR